jgi:DeoR/GlpR family transcriptional regulator of sugar metabolism
MRSRVTGPARVLSGDVFARERQEHIVRIVEEHGRARVSDLAARFGVSGVTIRKDLVVLEADHRLLRAHGGAIAIDRSRPELAFDVRERLQADEKARIGAAGAALVQDGESIVMDASTTALSVARHLMTRGRWSQLTVITNGLRIASELAGHPGITVLMLGGRVRWEALSVVGQLGDGLFSRINVQKAFLGAAGFTLETGLSDATDEEAQIKRSMVDAAREVIAIVDHTKWERSAFATFCATDRIGIFLTDEGAPDAMVRALIDRGVDVRSVSPGTAGRAAPAGRPDGTRSAW